jgi:hypothetical protein
MTITLRGRFAGKLMNVYLKGPVLDYKMKRRIFKYNDVNHPWELGITVEDEYGGKYHKTLKPYGVDTKTILLRYKTEEQCLEELQKIKDLE